jgi:hypothetical protein
LLAVVGAEPTDIWRQALHDGAALKRSAQAFSLSRAKARILLFAGTVRNNDCLAPLAHLGTPKDACVSLATVTGLPTLDQGPEGFRDYNPNKGTKRTAA